MEFELMMYPPTSTVEELVDKASATAMEAYQAKEITAIQLDLFLFEIYS